MASTLSNRLCGNLNTDRGNDRVSASRRGGTLKAEDSREEDWYMLEGFHLVAPYKIEKLLCKRSNTCAPKQV